MHWLLIISAMLAAWFALGWITMNVVLGLFRRGLFPIFGPNTEKLLLHFLVTESLLNALFSSNRNAEAEG